MIDWFLDVLAFHRKFCPDRIGTTPQAPSDQAVNLRLSLIDEEHRELTAAMLKDDLPGIADGAVDLIYVVIGTLVTYGIDPRPIWDAVHSANMAKEGGGVRGDGKVMKPRGWTPPDVAELLAEQESITQEPTT